MTILRTAKKYPLPRSTIYLRLISASYDPMMFLQSILTKCSSNLNGEKKLTTTPTGFLLTCDWTPSRSSTQTEEHIFSTGHELSLHWFWNLLSSSPPRWPGDKQRWRTDMTVPSEDVRSSGWRAIVAARLFSQSARLAQAQSLPLGREDQLKMLSHDSRDRSAVGANSDHVLCREKNKQ